VLDKQAPLLQPEGSMPRFASSVELGRRFAPRSADQVKLHFGMDDAAVPLRHVAPPLAALAVNLDRMKETRVRLETLWDHRSNVLSERVQARADPRRRRNVAQPPESCSICDRRTSMLSEPDHARSALASECR